MSNETVYDIIENDQNDFKYKVVNTTEQENENNNNNNFKCFNPNILSTNYYQYQHDEYLIFPELKHQYIYDNENRYLGYTGYNVNEFKCRSILYDTNDDPNEYNNVSISLNYNKEILYNYTTNNSGYQNASYHKLPTEFKYNYFINSSNRYSPINTYFDFKIHYNSKGLIDTFEYTGNNLVSANLLKDNIVVETLPKHIYRYDYDGLNRIKSETIEQHNPVDGSINTNTINYSYTSDGTLITDKELLVDEFNRVIDYNNAMFEYDFRNLLSKISKYQKNEYNNKVISDEIIFKYDDFGRRVEKLTNDYIIKYYYEDNKLIQENCYDHQNNLIYRFVYTYNIEGICGVIVYYYGNLLTENTALINYVRSGIVYNYVKDPFGNISKIIRNNKLIYEYHYDAWGNHSTNSYIDLSNSLTIIDKFILGNNPFRYRGYYYDVETGLFWLSSRYYSPELCRFIQPADVSSLNPSNINGLNLYSYSNNNPIGRVKSSYIANVGMLSGLDMKTMLSTFKLPVVNSNAGSSNYLNPHWENKLVDTNWPTFLSLSKDGFEAVNWGLSIYKGSLFFDNQENHSLYVSLGNISIFAGLVFPKDSSKDNKTRFGFDASANVIEIGYDGRIIDASVYGLAIGATYLLKDGIFKLEHGYGWWGWSVSIDFIELFKLLFGGE